MFWDGGEEPFLACVRVLTVLKYTVRCALPPKCLSLCGPICDLTSFRSALTHGLCQASFLLVGFSYWQHLHPLSLLIH